ncbi:uncharacterized protein DUF937 [Novosphingobium kunmingense]|uniref:Uncharacterized protein DUF937 n=1 Tax=Novosphingobium kunmingense TaxID=1211806 RepID=A0A2N0I1D4_9SPHN|nr:DUF937 domain-containing protein [Novosphingobium kunmingense]PKB25007.1 uncharacterized protein DUF937 [Novosphingobium kunmingense]
MAGRYMMEMLRRSGGLEAVSRELGVSPSVAAAGSDALLPALVGGFRNHAGKAGGGAEGVGQLIDALDDLGGGGLASNVLGPDSTDIARGNSVLAAIFGNKDVSAAVAAHASERSGVDTDTLKRMLPILAMLIGGYLSARAQTSASEGSGILDNLGTLLGDFLTDKGGSAPSRAAAAAARPSVAAILDDEGDRSVLNAILADLGSLRNQDGQ